MFLSNYRAVNEAERLLDEFAPPGWRDLLPLGVEAENAFRCPLFYIFGGYNDGLKAIGRIYTSVPPAFHHERTNAEWNRRIRRWRKTTKRLSPQLPSI